MSKALQDALSDPYRAVCPDCGSTDLARRSGTAVQSHGRAAQFGETTFYCRPCGRHLTEVYDKKRGHNVSVN